MKSLAAVFALLLSVPALASGPDAGTPAPQILGRAQGSRLADLRKDLDTLVAGSTKAGRPLKLLSIHMNKSEDLATATFQDGTNETEIVNVYSPEAGGWRMVPTVLTKVVEPAAKK